MGHHIFVSEFVFWTKAKDHIKHKTNMMEYMRSRKNTTKGMQESEWLGQVNTEFFKGTNVKFYSDFVVSEVYPALEKMFSEIQGISAPKSSTVDAIWYNNYEKGGNQEVHTHHGSDISGIYLTELNENNNTVFYSYPSSITKFSKETFTTEFLKEGDIILFPSSLLHYVLESTKNRTTIAFNIKFKH